MVGSRLWWDASNGGWAPMGAGKSLILRWGDVLPQLERELPKEISTNLPRIQKPICLPVGLIKNERAETNRRAEGFFAGEAPDSRN